MKPIDEDLVRRIHADLREDLDDAMELECEDLDREGVAAEDGLSTAAVAHRGSRRRDFRDLFRQTELAGV